MAKKPAEDVVWGIEANPNSSRLNHFYCISCPCTPELVSSELLAFSTVSGISEPRRHRNDDLKPLKAWKK